MTVVAWYDYCLTFSRELIYVWRKKISLISILFCLFRYSVLLSAIPVILILKTPPIWQAATAHVDVPC
ncbi:hypothetical protein C8Q72DRAFT_310615 [Fomitopsis betulina]|nr:hypothetical protein C8Q72DRAFT_310615 [Fomitopsis betulina]